MFLQKVYQKHRLTQKKRDTFKETVQVVIAQKTVKYISTIARTAVPCRTDRDLPPIAGTAAHAHEVLVSIYSIRPGTNLVSHDVKKVNYISFFNVHLTMSLPSAQIRFFVQYPYDSK